MTIPAATSSRATGIGLLIYGVGTTVAFLASGSPGGGYSDTTVANYISTGHLTIAAALWYLGAFSALALLVVATGVRRVPQTGGLLSGLTTVGAALSVTGAFVSGGLAVAMAEGGLPVRNGVPHAVVYTITEIGNLLAVCAPALCLGAAALVCATRASLPTWLRVTAVLGGICGILAPLFFTYFVYIICTAIGGIFAVARRPRSSARALAAPSPA